MAAAPGRPQSTRHPTAKNTMPEKNRRHLSIHALRWLPISWVLLAILLSASGAHAATIRTLLSTLDAATGNVWANGSYPRYQEFRTGETNVIISDVSVRIFEVFGGGFPRLKLCDSASANCQQLDYQETIGDTYRFTGAYPAYANTSVRIIFDCNCSGSAGYGIYLGPRVIPGASSSAFGYLFAVKVDAIAMPTVNQILPSAGPATGSTPVRLDGTGFLDATGVQFGDTDALHFQVDSDTQITATSPAHSPGAVGIKLMTAANGASISGSFTYVAAPAITAISPVAGPTAGGSPVTLIGTGFAAAPATGAVRFGAAAAAYTVLSDTQITAMAPAGAAGTVDVTVATIGGTSAASAGDRFTYAEAPTVASLAPATGPSAGGTQVTLTGTHLSAASTVKFGHQYASGVSVLSDTQLTAISPPGSGTVDLTVTSPGGTSAVTGSARFSYAGAPAITGLSTQRGPASGGSSVILSGSDFTGATEVRFGAVQATGFTVDSATRITATAPAGSLGTVAVSVTTPEGTSPASATAQFSYQADSASLQLAAGTVAMHLSGADCGFDGMPTNAAAPSSGAPPGFGFPYGQIAFKATGCTNGGTLRVALTLPRQVPPGAVLYKLVDGQWLPWDASVNGASIGFAVTDNDGSSTARATGDNDPAPGSIDDPIMIAVPAASATPATVPATGPGSLALLSLAIAGLVAGGLRHRKRG
ncbi:IPT/TIG domain-containing protein [Delftia sp. Cs1-4]|uniref:IPT/TIG domain-containing protein n=1 Tax=Delftia sp. (strain Cs1-4) TaxID=742013 RepID=UPI001C10F7CE|nr:IPT/TIG domain-containing protein [Delftia sp. Cs1-4]